MPQQPPRSAAQLLDLYYHDMRSHLLEVAAALDRLDRAPGETDSRLPRLLEAARVALDDRGDRARRFLEFLSV